MFWRTRSLYLTLFPVVWFALLLLGARPLQAQGDVAILVVDDFSGRSLDEISVDVADFSGLCLFDPQSIGQGHAMARGMGTNVPGWTHGQSVVTLLESINGAGLEIEEVGVTSYRAQDIVDQIRSRLDAPQRSFVVNMSFAFIPCELYPRLVELDRAAAQEDWDYYNSVRIDMEEQYRWFDASDNPMRSITDLGNVVVVASAGNFGFACPLLPAGGPNGVSVSANHSENQSTESLLEEPPVISNYGEIQMPGIWNATNEWTLVGTSYAAPRLSYRMGLFLQQYQGRCENGALPLDYENGSRWPDGEWTNIPIPSSESEFCGISGSSPVAHGFTSFVVEPPDVAVPVVPSCELSWNLNANYGTAELAAGFLPDPFTVGITSGGPCNASVSTGSQCVGYTTAAPDFRLRWSGRSSRIRIFFQAQGGGDTTLIINGPSGSWYCNDDSSNFNPMVEFINPGAGQYDIWVGSYNQNEGIGGTLSITERDLRP